MESDAVDLASEATNAAQRLASGRLRPCGRSWNASEHSRSKARSNGWSWQAIADELHVSKQAVHEEHRERGRTAEGDVMFERFTPEARRIVLGRLRSEVGGGLDELGQWGA